MTFVNDEICNYLKEVAVTYFVVLFQNSSRMNEEN